MILGYKISASLDRLQSADYQDKAQTRRDHQGLLGFAFNMVLNALRMAVVDVGTLALALTGSESIAVTAECPRCPAVANGPVLL